MKHFGAFIYIVDLVLGEGEGNNESTSSNDDVTCHVMMNTGKTETIAILISCLSIAFLWHYGSHPEIVNKSSSLSPLHALQHGLLEFSLNLEREENKPHVICEYREPLLGTTDLLPLLISI